MDYWDSAEKERNFVQLGQCSEKKCWTFGTVQKKRNVVHLGQFRKRKQCCTIGTVQKKKEMLYVLLGQCRKKKEILYIWDSVEKERNVVHLGQC